MSENIKPLSAVEGKAYINGIEVMDSVKMTIRFVPKVANYRIVGKKGTHRRWVGYDITGTLDEYKTTARYERIVKEYISNGKKLLCSILLMIHKKSWNGRVAAKIRALP